MIVVKYSAIGILIPSKSLLTIVKYMVSFPKIKLQVFSVNY